MTDDLALTRLEQQLGRLLVTGVIVSAVMLFIGLVLYFLRPDGRASDLLLAGGLFVLMGTPMLRVVVSFVEYVRVKDWFFMLTTLVVLAVLAGTVLLAIYGS